MQYLVNLFLHLDVHLADFVAQYGVWVYALLFLIVFAETGFVVTPFLPGDSLLFATGALCARGDLNALTAFGLLAGSAFAGNAVNRDSRPPLGLSSLPTSTKSTELAMLSGTL